MHEILRAHQTNDFRKTKIELGCQKKDVVDKGSMVTVWIHIGVVHHKVEPWGKLESRTIKNIRRYSSTAWIQSLP